MNATATEIYAALLARPGDVPTMLVLADALEESGEDALAAAYRWAARRRKWPFVRRDYRLGCDVFDWDRPGRHRQTFDREREAVVRVPGRARLPLGLFRVVCALPDKRYGSVNDAFVLLARALPKVRRSVTGAVLPAEVTT